MKSNSAETKLQKEIRTGFSQIQEEKKVVSVMGKKLDDMTIERDDLQVKLEIASANTVDMKLESEAKIEMLENKNYSIQNLLEEFQNKFEVEHRICVMLLMIRKG